MGLHYYAKRLCRLVVNHPSSIYLPLGKKAVAPQHDHYCDRFLLFNCAAMGCGKKHKLLGNL